MSVPENVQRVQSPPAGAAPLTLTPVFTGVQAKAFRDKAFCTEDRWYPRLNISWGADRGEKQNRVFLVNIRYRSKSANHMSQCEQCFTITLQPQKPRKHKQLLRLFSGDLVQCKDTEPPAHLYVRVHTLNEEGLSLNLEKRLAYTQEASISLPVDQIDVPITGLPTQYRELVPEVFRDMSTLNPIHWTSPLLLHNLSCSRSIEVQFQIMPENQYVTTYSVYLHGRQTINTRLQAFRPEMNDTVGTVTFYNLTEGVYYAQLNVGEPEGSYAATFPIMLKDK